MSATVNVKWSRYWQFYWPLALMGLAMLLGQQFKNATLARYPDAATELAAFAIAFGFFQFFHTALIFLPQLATVYVRSIADLRRALRFVLCIGCLLMLPILWLGFTASGGALIRHFYDVDSAMLETSTRYLRVLWPLLLVDALRNFGFGLLIQNRQTGLVTWINIFNVTLLGLGLYVGFQMGLAAVWTASLSQLLAALCSGALTLYICRRRYRPPSAATVADIPEFRELWRFFWPTAMTSIVFALSRPIIFAFASRADNGIMLIAALRISFDFSMIFLNPVNQFRHMIVAFGEKHLYGVVRFMAAVVCALSGMLLLTAFTPLSTWVFGDLLGAEGGVRILAVQALPMLALVPPSMALRNYFHGLAMVRKNTLRMAFGSILRVSAIALGSWGALAMGWLNAPMAAFLLALGFLAEALAMAAVTRFLDRRHLRP